MMSMLRSSSTTSSRLRVALRAVGVLVCAVVVLGFAVCSSVAQQTAIRAAFEETEAKPMPVREPLPGTVRLVAGQQNTQNTQNTQKPPTPKPAKPLLPPPPRKSPPLQPTPSVPPQQGANAAPEELPAGAMKATLPLAGAAAGDGLELSQDDREKGLITLIVRDKPLSQVVALLAQTQHLNIVAANDIDVMISITLRKVPVEDALTAVLAVANYTWVKRGNIILITSVADSVNLPADVQGRQIQVFELDYVSAAGVAETVQSFLSPIGKASVTSSSPTNNRLTQERVVVEDLPESLARIANYIAQIDRPPRQVLIEAHVLQVVLDETTRCGVNLDQLVRIGGSKLNLTTTGFANPSAEQAFLATLDGGDLGGVIEAIQTTTDAKTLGSPKLLVLNEQEARLQVGEHLGFKVSTTTETSTIQNVQFLDVGVVLRLTPRITREGRVLLHVRPEVSKGNVNPETGLPESQTAELETDIMLCDGQGMVIGGLIKENDSINQSKIPWLGNVRGIGWLFRRTETIKERVEIIVALVPRIQPYDAKYQAFEQGELVKASVPLMHGPLCRTYRPWDPILPDGKRVAYPLIPPRHPLPPTGYYHDEMPEYVIPPDPLPEQHFYGEGCEQGGLQMGEPQVGDPFLQGEELPPPGMSDGNLGRTPLINDQPIALKLQPGAQK